MVATTIWAMANTLIVGSKLRKPSMRNRAASAAPG